MKCVVSAQMPMSQSPGAAFTLNAPFITEVSGFGRTDPQASAVSAYLPLFLLKYKVTQAAPGSVRLGGAKPRCFLGAWWPQWPPGAALSCSQACGLSHILGGLSQVPGVWLRFQERGLAQVQGGCPSFRGNCPRFWGSVPGSGGSVAGPGRAFPGSGVSEGAAILASLAPGAAGCVGGKAHPWSSVSHSGMRLTPWT